jgi:hypothetical protein
LKKKNILLIHFFYWFYIINQALFPIYIGKMDQSYLADNQYWLEISIMTLLNVVSFYVIYFSFPRLLKIKNKVLAIISGFFMVALVTAFRVPVELAFWKLFGNMSDKELAFQWMFAWNNLRLVIITGIYAVLIRFMIFSIESQKLRDELINQQQAGELALMRSQVNPHFLFNTLNNIYSLVYRKSDQAGEAVIRLSSIMRYMFYDATTDKVPLEKEIEYLKSYIELQKLRIKNPEFVLLQIEGITEGCTIAPMMLISFVENAFKHGSKKHNPGIIIHLSTSKDRIDFNIVNYLKKSTLTEDDQESGFGLANIRRRLELIYPGHHKMLISKDAQTFRIHLEIMN